MAKVVTAHKVDIAADKMFGIRLKQALTQIENLKQRINELDQRITEILKDENSKLSEETIKTLEVYDSKEDSE